MAMNPNGRAKARLFRQVREITGRRCDLDEIAATDGIQVFDAQARDPGWTACLVTRGHGGLISCKPGQNPGRRRFSIAHELAHYHIPTHRATSAVRTCALDDLEATDGWGAQKEWEANSFAAYLLMPGRLFRADSRDMPMCFRTARTLADLYGVSITAAARRMVEATSEYCALVATTDRRVTWQDRHEYYWRMPTSGQVISPDTLAADVYRGVAPSPDPEEVSPYAWIHDNVGPNFVLLESNHFIPSQGQVLSLLWAPDYDEGYR